MLVRWFGATTRFSIWLMTAVALTACGGGGDGVGSGGFLGGGGSEEVAEWSVTMSLTDADGNAVTTLEGNSTATLSVTVTDTSDESAIASEVVSLSGDLVTIAPASGTRTTDASGIAQFTISAGNISGAGTLTASTESPSGTVEAVLNFNVEADTLLISSALLDDDGNAITKVDPLTPGVYTVTLTNDSGDPVSGTVVSATTTIGLLLPDSGTALTNEMGVASFSVQSDGTTGAGTLTGSVTAAGTTIESSVNFELDNNLPYTLTPTFLDAADEPVDVVDTLEPFTLSVSVINNRTGDPVPFQTVVADIGELGSITPTTGESSTDADGVATFSVLTGGTIGSFPVVVSTTLAGGSASGEGSINVIQAVRKLGYFDNGVFVDGVIQVEPAKQLSPTGTAALTLAVVDENDERATSVETVTITSECLFGEQATLDPASPIVFSSQVTVSYTAAGCSGADEITATLDSTGATAVGTIEISQLDAQAISFDAATPELIGLRDTGNATDLTEKSTVTFKVTDLDGNAVSNVKVDFELSTTIGGIALSCLDQPECSYPSPEDSALGRSTTGTDRTDLDGIASVELLSGYVATAVRVIAYIDLDEDGVKDTNEPQTTSKGLVITTGLPDQNSISLSSSLLNVEGAYDTDGKTAEVTVRMADKFNNPVPDGTQAVFTTEYGSIVGSCVTTDGACVVTWTSQSPRTSAYATAITINSAGYDCPAHNESSGPCPFDIADPAVNPPGYARGGRSTILVTAIGEESFVDSNANGIYDEGEFWTNLPEAFRDDNEDGVYTPTQRNNCSNPTTADDICLAGFEEDFIDFNESGTYNLNNQPTAPAGSGLPNGLYNGILCQPEDDAVGICSRDLLNVRDSLVIVNSFSDAGAFELLVIEADEGNEPGPGDLLDGGETYLLYVADTFNNPPPPGSSISYEGSGRCDVLTPAPTIGDSNRAGAFAVAFAVSTADGEEPSADPDQVSILFTLPSGSTTVVTYGCEVEDPPPPDEGGGDGDQTFGG